MSKRFITLTINDQLLLMTLHRNIITALAAVSLCAITASATQPATHSNSAHSVNVTPESVPTEQYAAAVHVKQQIHAVAEQIAEQLVVDDMLKYAKTHIGKRYRRGSAGPKTFDCSGFTSYVFRQFGYELSRDSRSQYRQGTQVGRNEAQPGDLIFFSGRAAGKTVGHVGIITDINPATGSVTFIHASTSRGVRIDKLSDSYYSRRYIGIKRVMSDDDLGLK